MADILEFKKPSKSKRRSKKAQQKTGGNTLCKEGHHQWKIVQEKQFETHSGRLMTVYKCARCNKTKSKLL